MKKYINIFISVLLLASCSKTPRDQIINYTEEKYGANFKEENIDLSKVFGFKWQTLYIFSPLMYPENIEKEIGYMQKEVIRFPNIMLTPLKMHI